MATKYVAKLADALQASADFLGNGAIEINLYEPEIMDQVRRNSVARQRFRAVDATGHPHRYFEETAIGTATTTDPRNISPTPTGPTRVERSAFIKAMTCQTNFSMFDVEVTKQQGRFPQLEAKDISDIANAILILSGQMIWTGNDTSLAAPTTQQYMSVISQITQQGTIGAGASIVDGVKAQVALMMANETYVVRPTAIYANPVTVDLIEREAKASEINMNMATVVPGVSVPSIRTQAGDLPLIQDPFLVPTTGAQFGFPAPPVGLRNHWLVIVSEPEIERPVVHGGTGNMEPRLFQLGLLAGLQAQYVGILFDTIIVKGPSYNHAVVILQRP
jgi:hypothetical protein